MAAPGNGGVELPGNGSPEIPIPNFYTQAQFSADGYKAAGWFADMWAKLWASIIPGLGVVIQVLVSGMDTILATVTTLITDFQGNKYPGFFQLVAAVIGDLLGREVDPAHIRSAFQRGGEIAGVRQIGGDLYDQLKREFAPSSSLTPESGVNAGKAFLGFLMAFAIRQGNVAFLAELLPEEFRICEGIREYGELMAKNLGLGRLARRALQPLLQVLIADPLEWSLRQEFRPTLLGASQAIRAHNRNLIDDETFNREMAYAGYSPQRIDALTTESLEQATTGNLFTLFRWGQIDENEFRILMKRRGVHPVDSDRIIAAMQRADADSDVQSMKTVIKNQLLGGYIDSVMFRDILDQLPLVDEEKRRFRDNVFQQLEFPRSKLTLAEIQSAFVNGIVDVSDLQDFLKREGYSEDDSLTLQYLTLLKLDTLEARKAVAQFGWDKAKAKALAKGQPEPPMPAILAQ